MTFQKPSKLSILARLMQETLIASALQPAGDETPEVLRVDDHQGLPFAEVRQEDETLTLTYPAADRSFTFGNVKDARDFTAELLSTHAPPRATHHNFMIDLETLGTTSHSLVWAIGVVPFSIENDELSVGAGMQFLIKPQDAVKRGAKIDVETIGWWMRQSPEAQAHYHLALSSGLSEPAAISALKRFMAIWSGENSEFWQPWGNGALFDMGMIEQLCERNDLPNPWQFTRPRCYRTVTQLAEANGWNHRNVRTIGTRHDALDDARTQIHRLHSALQHLNTFGLKNIYTPTRSERRAQRAPEAAAPEAASPETTSPGS